MYHYEGNVDISLGTNHTRFRGLQLHIHLLESELSISLNMLMQRWLIRNKMLLSLVSQMRHKCVMGIINPCKANVSKSSGGGWIL